nr:FKBP-type peptidyl-prolyl cis-trans isomerase [Leucobacter edaphi]
MRCALPGEQTAVVAPYKEVFGSTDPAALGIEGLSQKDSIVVVLNVGKIDETVNGSSSGEPGTLAPDKLLKKAEGKAQQPPKGFPSVTLAKSGEPTITIPKDVKPPSKLEYATLIKGDGEKVKSGDRVYVNYRGVIWRTGEEFDSSWSRGEPVPFITTGVIPGFEKALVGQTVGSQVISVVPAEDGGYGAAGLERMGHKKDDVMVFVLDVVGTVHAK